jgi:Polyketide cyclase / dehydrase and lipid transport
VGADATTTGKWRFSSSARSGAPPEVVWPLVGEVARWTQWSWMTRAELVHDGTPCPDAVGAVRSMGVGPVGSREEVVVWDPPHHLGYVLRRGVPVRNYRADVYLVEDGAGTTATWEGLFDELIPGTGPIMRAMLSRITGGFARRVCRYAEGLVDL